ncbi:hypothetical protein LCGC14_2410110 [marine sediment metagenome]|uniref:Uncharacterized protein n=1 Tax=marine sediment metagenome TaxID=412755 RepID=A0A0F9E4X4_9ZZZZ
MIEAINIETIEQFEWMVREMRGMNESDGVVISKVRNCNTSCIICGKETRRTKVPLSKPIDVCSTCIKEEKKEEMGK